MNKHHNQKIKQAVIQRPDVLGTEFSLEDDTKKEKNIDTARLQAAQNRLKARRDLMSVSDQVAEDKFVYKNYMYPGAREAFPMNVNLQSVDKYYPYANGGPLFVDEPQHKDDIKVLELKVEAMKKLGHRYLLLKPGMKHEDCLEALA